MLNIPNILTGIRILLIPVFIATFYIPTRWASLVTVLIFIFAALTDWLDGYLARTLGQTSKLGEFLDPVADKLIVVIALVLLVSEDHLYFVAIPAAIIIGREIVISALREWMAELGKRASVAVSNVGKVKTVLQMFAIIFLLVARPTSYFNYQIILFTGYILLFIAAFLTLWTMCMYLHAAWPELSLKE